ncbi:hypothetical protein FZC78_12645 [Rossellomorea vietnamensis]|uniref:Uncharacterized protein n=1 Tax=Rossellomorea vietnamensis TaxID=218284 RepID=A0A5D4NPV4_9BACI|nr:hypothetical protein [Rossellomorea vietnamensis]TYS16187.1 hypothetical protein FZC78_12645 [Rossellomorea vietnamensis]
MKKLLLIVLFSFPVMLAGCSKNEEDTKEHIGVIGEGEAFDYTYIMLKEKEGFTWEIGYKGERSLIEETAANEEDVMHYMEAVSSAKAQFWQIVVSITYLLAVACLTLFLFIKKRNLFKETITVIAVFAGFGIWNAMDGSLDLNHSLLAIEASYRVLTI